MNSYKFSTCDVIEGEIVIIKGLITPVTYAENRREALDKLNDWFIEHKCRPYQEVH